MFENKFYLFLFFIFAVCGVLWYMPILMVGCGAFLFKDGFDNLRMLRYECYKGMPFMDIVMVGLFAVVYTTLTLFTGGMVMLGIIYMLGI